MKKKILIILIVMAVLLLIGFRYSVVERPDILPEDVRLGFGLFDTAHAESAPAMPGARPVNLAPARPTSGPAEKPTAEAEPTAKATPTAAATAKPTATATAEPAATATAKPTATATAKPTATVTAKPTATVTAKPTATATATPTATATAESAAPAAPEIEPSKTAEPTAEPLMQRGSKGDNVKKLQQRLRELGFLTGKADGIFGKQTEQAVIDFKRHLYDMEEERHAAEMAEAQRLAEAALEALTPEPAATGNPEDSAAPEPTEAPEAPAESHEPTEAPVLESTPAPQPEFDGLVDQEIYDLLAEKGFDEYQVQLASGARGAEVKRLQRRLKALGYLSGGADGIFGKQTKNAVIAFQQRHSLSQDGIAGEKTQRALYHSSAKQQVKPTAPNVGYSGKYMLQVSTAKQRVYAYAWNEKNGGYTDLVRTMVCSTGLAATPTPKGTYSSTTGPVVRWGYFPKFDVWAQYLYRIKGPYLFHSVLYEEADESTVKWGSVNKLGSPASHGCIRLDVPDAKWIYNNCPAGTVVQVI